MSLRTKIRGVAREVLPPVAGRLLTGGGARKARDASHKAYAAAGSSLEILGAARTNFESAIGAGDRGDMQASTKWSAQREEMRERLHSFSSVREAVIFGQASMGFDHRRRAAEITSFKPFEAALLAEFPDQRQLITGLGDSSFSEPSSLGLFGGRFVSNVHYFHLRYLLAGLAHAGAPEVVCEIGGGYGAPARLWLDNPVHTPRTYVIIDFPESLFFAEVFLRLNMPGKKIRYVSPGNPIGDAGEISDSVVLCPIEAVAALKGLEIGLVINAGSLQEMTEEWVSYWMAWLDEQPCRYFYSLNYFAHPLDYMSEGANSWSPRLSPRWVVRSQLYNPASVIQHSTSGFAEIVAERTADAAGIPGQDAQARYAWTQERDFDAGTLLEAIDAFRRAPDVDIAWDILNRCLDESPFVPKESLHLIEYVEANASDAFRAKHSAEIEARGERLRRMRAEGFNDQLFGDRIVV